MGEMDTPERSKNAQMAASIGKFEDSPVFNFLNNLSPIKPVKPVYISQTINPLSFASLPSVFSSPHLNSLKESKFLRRHSVSDPSKPEFSSDELKENKASDCQNASDPSYGSSKLVVEFAENLNRESDVVNPSLSCLNSSAFVEQQSVNMAEATVEGLGDIDQSDWDSLIADASDLVVFDSPNKEPCNEAVDPATTFYRSIRNAIQNAESLSAVVCGGAERNEAENKPQEGTQMIESGGLNDIVGDASFFNPNQKMDYENLSGLCRGMRRRCLVFEKAGARRKHMEENSPSDLSLLLANEGNASSSNKQTIRNKAENDSSRLLPGIGLHLNALAATPKDFKIVNHESSSSGRLLLGTSSSTNFPPTNSCQDLLSNTLAEYSLQREIDSFDNGGILIDDRSQERGYAGNEDMNPSSPKKRRRRMEQGGDGESCKRCNCKKSKCLKLYCECFAAGVYCVEPCACIDCFNKPIHEDTVLATRKQIESRNPLAFAPKVIRGSDSLSEIRDDFTNTPASARHKRGCNCKKSGCLKKYCECYQGGVGCSINCRCEGCKNAFGRKDGSTASGTEPEYEEEEEENDATENATLDKSLYKAAILDDLEQAMDSTPLGMGRQPFQPLSKKRPPRATFPSICTYASLSSASQNFGKSNLFPSLSKFSQSFETVEEEEMPHFLQGGGSHSPISGIKSSSPNRKRVSPPQSLETLTGLRSSRKLILQSIPSFPSLSQNQ